MKKHLIILFLLQMCCVGFAQKQVILKGGTPIPVEAIRDIRATDVDEGQVLDCFKVSRDVHVGGVIAIPAGTTVYGKVYEARRSKAFGTRGRLGIRLNYLYLPNGEAVTFTSSEIAVKGANRTALSVIIFICTFVPLPCGGGAKLKAGTEYEVIVSANTEITVK